MRYLPANKPGKKQEYQGAYQCRENPRPNIGFSRHITYKGPSAESPVALHVVEYYFYICFQRRRSVGVKNNRPFAKAL
jgi:hypothetical protein